MADASLAKPKIRASSSYLSDQKIPSSLDTSACESEETIPDCNSEQNPEASTTSNNDRNETFCFNGKEKDRYGSDELQKYVHTPVRPVQAVEQFQLHCHFGALWLSILFTTLAVTSWTFICILQYRPLFTYSYRATSSIGSPLAPRAKSIDWYRASQVLESVVGMLTIPVTSAVCVRAAITFTQKQKHRVNARQALILADRGWSSASTAWNILFPDWRKKNMTVFLLLSLLLSVFGFCLAPVKQVLVTQETMKTPTEVDGGSLGNIKTWSDLFWDHPAPQASAQLVGLIRSKFMSTTIDQPQPHLWVRSLEKDCGSECSQASESSLSLSLLREMQDPFMSQIPSFFNTGLIKQYALRLNSSAEYSEIEDAELPLECGNSVVNFYKKYSAVDSKAVLEICMPGNLTASPWNPSNDRQDIEETLYFKIRSANETFSLVRIDSGSTAGYFELPSLLNDNTVGPLLKKGPKLGFSSQDWRAGQIAERIRMSLPNNWPPKVHPGLPLEQVINRGPLLTTALAMFGDGSPLSVAASITDGQNLDNSVVCNEWSFPFIEGMLSPANGCKTWGNVTYWTHFLAPRSSSHYSRQVADHLEKALFLTNEAFIIDSSPYNIGTMIVNYDSGVDTIIPSMSFASMVTISCLLGIFLIALSAMAIYSASSAHWTGSMDAFAILRIGAAAGPKLSYQVGQKLDDISALDEIPCWVGDANPEDGFGQLKIGADEPLRRNRTYTFDTTQSGPTP